MDSFTIHGPDRARRTKPNIVRTRTGCQNCRKRRRKCDEGRPECQGCVKRGIKCSGYERTIAFKDVSGLAAESSRKFEAARWAELRAEDEQRGRKRRRAGNSPETAGRVETLSSDAASDLDGDRSSSSSSSGPVPLPRNTSPRHCRRAPPAFTRTAPDAFDMADRETTAIDPALFQSPPLIFQPLDFDNSPSFDVTDTPEDSPPTDAASLVTYTPNTSLDSPLPALIIRDSPAREAALIQHFETHVLSNLPVPMAFGRSYTDNSCFRHAILALSAINKSYLETRTRESNPSTFSSSSLSNSISSTRTAKTAARLQQRRSAVGREHYLAAVSSLYRRLDLSDPSSREQHAAAALMLAYYEIETGSPFGSLRHARGLDALLSRLDLHSPTTTSSSSGGGAVPSSMPEIFKAWRILRYDVRHISAPYRATSVLVDAHDAYAALDPRLAIRDVYTLAWNLVGRVEMEASFPSYSPEKGSRSRQAATWIRDVAGRVCDRRNVERGDYHAEDISGEEVVRQCGRFSRGLDAWHAVLPAEARPTVCAAGARPFVAGPGFEAFPILGFGGGDRVAVEYMMYVTARMIVSYLLSVFGDGQEELSGGGGGIGGGGGAAETTAWARVLLGVVCGMQHKHMMFSYVSPVSNVAQAVLLTEGAAMATAVLDGVIPHVLGQGIPTAELADWLYLKKGVEIVRRERVRGRSVRAFMLTLDEDYEKGHFDTECSFIVFGDYNGKGHFRDVYSIDGEF